jgi:site-specific DNA-methyltransferase (adenine-specific)
MRKNPMAKPGRPSLYADEKTKWRELKRRQRQRLQAAGAEPRIVLLGTLQVPCLQVSRDITLYQGDALQIAAALQHTGAVILDPPYGTNFDHTKVRRSTTSLQGGSAAAHWDANVLGDDHPFDPLPWLRYRQVILWGANHYRLPAANGYIVWDKRAGGTPDDFSGTDLAWSNIPGSSRLHTQLWRGTHRGGEENVARAGKKLHPQQKPVALMELCVSLTRGRVLDPYMGSGTTGLACLRLQRPFVGIELDPTWFRVACVRLAAAAQQLQFFPLTS